MYGSCVSCSEKTVGWTFIVKYDIIYLMKKLLNTTKCTVSFLASVGFILAPFLASAKNADLNLSDPSTMVCEALGRIGMGCGVSKSTSYVTPTPNSTFSPNPSENTDNLNLTAAIYNSGKNGKRGDVVLVRVLGQNKIYEIIGGKKHFIPTKDIFYDYGFRNELIQNITIEELNKYPRVKLIKVEDDSKKTYYLTEGQILRLIPNKKISDSYGDREEDIIVISKKEFNFYPQNQFVFLDSSLYKDVFQLVNRKKRYITPMAVKKMRIRDVDIAPVNQTEFSYYKIASPVVL